MDDQTSGTVEIDGAAPPPEAPKRKRGRPPGSGKKSSSKAPAPRVAAVTNEQVDAAGAESPPSQGEMALGILATRALGLVFGLLLGPRGEQAVQDRRGELVTALIGVARVHKVELPPEVQAWSALATAVGGVVLGSGVLDGVAQGVSNVVAKVEADLGELAGEPPTVTVPHNATPENGAAL